MRIHWQDPCTRGIQSFTVCIDKVHNPWVSVSISRPPLVCESPQSACQASQMCFVAKHLQHGVIVAQADTTISAAGNARKLMITDQ